jgi:peroxin-6
LIQKSGSFLPFFSENKMNSLVKIFKPSVQSLAKILDISCSILLHGSKGSGKNTLVHLCAEFLGLHVHTINCYLINSEISNETHKNIETVFEEASSFSPCVLLLKNIDAFKSTSNTPLIGYFFILKKV